MSSENLTSVESVNTTTKSRKKGRVIAAAALAAGIALVTAGGFAGITSEWDLGKLSVSTFKKMETLPVGMTATAVAGDYKDIKPGGWDSKNGTAATVEFENFETTARNLDVKKMTETLADGLTASDGKTAATASQIAAFKKHMNWRVYKKEDTKAEVTVTGGKAPIAAATTKGTGKKTGFAFYPELPTVDKNTTPQAIDEINSLSGLKLPSMKVLPSGLVQ